jgi:HK97 family phage portal protein
MRLFNKSKQAVEKKSNPTGAAVFMDVRGQTKPRELKAYYNEGYIQNVIIYRCISEITRALASVKIELYQKDKEQEEHPVLDLLRCPNPTQSWQQFIRCAFTEYLISGNMFITMAGGNELWVQSSQKMEVEAGESGIPKLYIYNKRKTFAVDQISGYSEVFHFKTYNPDTPFVGLPPLRHVALAADWHNNGLTWNAALLKNGARPSGQVVFKDEAAEPSQEMIARIRSWLKTNLQGAENAGEVGIFAGAEWKPTSENAKDMDFLAAMREAVKYVASAFGVPLPLVDNDAASFNNIEQAKERFWTDTILPLLDEFLQSFGNWLLPQFGNDLHFCYDADSIHALESVRQRKFDRTVKTVDAGLLTINEGREALGYEANSSPVANSLLIQSSRMMIGDADMSLSDDSPADIQDNTTAPTPPQDAPVANTAMSGAQVSALQQIVQAVADGLLPDATAVELILVAFPTLDRAAVSAMVKPAVNFTPAAPDLAKALGMDAAEIKAMLNE